MIRTRINEKHFTLKCTKDQQICLLRPKEFFFICWLCIQSTYRIHFSRYHPCLVDWCGCMGGRFSIYSWISDTTNYLQISLLFEISVLVISLNDLEILLTMIGISDISNSVRDISNSIVISEIDLRISLIQFVISQIEFVISLISLELVISLNELEISLFLFVISQIELRILLNRQN